jgi:hypothetical protein
MAVETASKMAVSRAELRAYQLDQYSELYSVLCWALQSDSRSEFRLTLDSVPCLSSETAAHWKQESEKWMVDG